MLVIALLPQHPFLQMLTHRPLLLSPINIIRTSTCLSLPINPMIVITITRRHHILENFLTHRTLQQRHHFLLRLLFINNPFLLLNVISNIRQHISQRLQRHCNHFVFDFVFDFVLTCPKGFFFSVL